MTYRITQDDYFNLRRNSEALKKDGARFEAAPWVCEQLSRSTSDGWRMKLYRFEGDVEVCIIAPDGTSKTFS